jgi:hypothetical protein
MPSAIVTSRESAAKTAPKDGLSIRSLAVAAR